MTQVNGNQTKGNAQNGNGKVNSKPRQKTPPVVQENGEKDSLGGNFLAPIPDFDQAVILRQSPSWSRGIVWTLMGVTTVAFLWAYFAKIEQVVQATGQLKPQDTVKKIQAPFNGVVKEIFVEDGEVVKKGELLISLDATASTAQLASYTKIRQSLTQENQFYRTLMQQPLNANQVEMMIAKLKLPEEIASLARSRVAIVTENELFQNQLGNPAKISLNSEQILRLQAGRSELASRAMAARLEMDQLQKQFTQAEVQLANARTQLITDKQMLAEIKNRNNQALVEAQRSLEIEKGILGNVEPLLDEGALAKMQVERQRQSINDRYQKLIEQRANGMVEYNKQEQQLESHLADIKRFTEEKKRLQFSISQAQAKLNNTINITEKDLRDKFAENQKRVADIDSQLTKNIIENEKKISETDSQISQAQMTLKYQDLRSPVAGKVFDLKAFPGYVTPPNQTEPLLKIVPQDHLIAEVDVTNKDIGFIKLGYKADVRIDTFPFSEFGDIKGEIISIGSDALPPDETHRFYRFPVKIKLDSQDLKVRDKSQQPLPLQSGMGVSANIKIDENRTVMSIFTEMFTKKVDTIKQVR